MGDIKLPKNIYLWSVAAIYLFAFASLYVQIPGLYGSDGILPARKVLRYTGKPLLEQLEDMPTLLLLSPYVGLDTEQGMELLCLLGMLISFAAIVVESLRDSIVFLILWCLYFSLYQVGQVFLYFQWDSLLLETGFLTILVAPLNLFRWRSTTTKYHDQITFWLVRWLFFRLMFASGVVKLTSRCPTWWGLTALTYHYESQCIPTPASWFAHQLPVWFQKLSVVITYIIEIPIPILFFAPIRQLRLFAFYSQVLLQVLIIITGNYNFFNLLTIVLGFSLLDDEHINFWLRRSKRKASSSSWLEFLWHLLIVLVELTVYALLVYLTCVYFSLEINWEKKRIESKTAFTYHEFIQWLKTVIVPTIWIGVLSLTWEIVTAMLRCALVRGFFWKLWTTLQWAVFATAAAGMFAISLVPYTYLEYEANSNIWPAVNKMYTAVDRYQLVNSYGLFRRMTGVGGRPEVIVEGSYDQQTWKEIEFTYKPGNVSAAPPMLIPHQPRLDWQMWFAALAHQSHSPWFTSLLFRLLQGKKEVIRLLQVDEANYPFIREPPVYIRAQLYKYWYTTTDETGSVPQQWWRRRYVEEFYPTVFLGDPKFDDTLNEHGFKDKGPLKRSSDAWLPYLLKTVRDYTEPFTGHMVLWSLFATAVAVCIVKGLTRRPQTGSKSKSASVPKKPEGKDVSGIENRLSKGDKRAEAAEEFKFKHTAQEKSSQSVKNVKKKK